VCAQRIQPDDCKEQKPAKLTWSTKIRSQQGRLSSSAPNAQIRAARALIDVKLTPAPNQAGSGVERSADF